MAHVTRDSDTTFKVKRSKAALLTAVLARQQLQRWAWKRVGHGKLLLRCRLLCGARRFGAHGGGGGILWRPPAYSFVHVQTTNDVNSISSSRSNRSQYSIYEFCVYSIRKIL